MRIVLLSMNYAPEMTGIGKYSGEMAEDLVDRGHEVHVVCAPPYYPSWKVQAGYSAGRYQTQRVRDGLTVHRCPVWIPSRLGGLTRLLHLASFALSSFPVLLRLVLWQPHLVFAVAPAFVCAPFAWVTARLAGARAWLHMQDLEVDAAFELGMLRQPLMRRLALAVERFVLRRFDVVSTISSRMMRKLAVKGLPLHETEFLPNWVDGTAIHAGASGSALRQQLDISASQVVCLFSGTMNRKQGLPVLIEAARRMQHDPRVVFVLCGNGELRPELEALAEGMHNVRFLDLQPVSGLNALLNMADVHLLPQLRGAADLVMPSKLAGMLASGRPVVAASQANTEIASIVGGCGIVIEPECADSFARAIGELAGDGDMRQRLGEAGRAYAVQVLDARKVFDRLESRLLGFAEEGTSMTGATVSPAPETSAT
ncbi:glycosyltransferase WbuB [Rhizobacter sp. J219]|uniref:glycosyltransferase WbuB n=1 Tax=Rhizobacter sp. J219 TaxID=2898430 RepID=UPI002151A1E5|nr:glycosyltransferase WbuB [Rhizobacter sp. J219]MCR5881868.1 glycosyltransferase WbuB [Rhizobacter sp. J219]